jgi:hypothetical protein
MWLVPVLFRFESPFGAPPDGVQVTPSEYRFSKEDVEEYVASWRNRRKSAVR